MKDVRGILKRVYLVLRSLVFAPAYLIASTIRKPWAAGRMPENILIIPMQRLGDNIVSIPAYRAIRRGFPSAKITVFANSYAKDLLERIPAFDHVVSFPDSVSFIQKVRQLRALAVAFDLAVDFTSDYTVENALLCWLSRAQYRLGFNIAGRGFLFNRPLEYPHENISSVEILLTLPKSLGLKIDDKGLQFHLKDEERQRVGEFLRQAGVGRDEIIVAVHPGGHYSTQRWPLERWARVADGIIEKYGVKVILLGDRQDSQKIQEAMAQQALVFQEASMPGFLAIIERAKLLLCNNSGPLHAAAALGTPTVSTMGPTMPEKWWPQGDGHIVLRKQLPCMPCNEGYCRIKTHECMRQLSVADMLDAVADQFKIIKMINHG